MGPSQAIQRDGLGAIPTGWEHTPLKRACTLHNGRAYALDEWERSGVPVIRLQNLTGGDDYYYSSLQLPENKYCQRGDLLYMWSATFGPHLWAGDRAIYHYHIWKVVPNEQRATREFLFYKLLEITEDKKSKAANGGTMLHVTKSSMEATLLALPPVLEQRAIAEALSDVDGLLSGLDRLIAKKRDLKQAAMQQLLTGQTRLPGFRGEWDETPLARCLLARPDYGINAPAVQYSDRLPAYLRITDISDDGRFRPDPRVSVRAEGTAQFFLRDGEIVFARTGASVGKSYLYSARDGELVFAGFLIRVRPDPEKLVPGFLAAFATTKPYWDWVRMMSMRSGQPGINGNEYAQMPLTLPRVGEQTAIAEVLREMDVELAALEQRRDKTRALKQAVMQELLTGKTRLL